MGNHGHLKSVIGKTHGCQRTAVHQTTILIVLITTL